MRNTKPLLIGLALCLAFFVKAQTGTLTILSGTGAIGNSGDGGPAIDATFGNIFSIATDASYNLYIVDRK